MSVKLIMFFLETPEVAVALSLIQTDQALDIGRGSDVWVISKGVEE